MVFGEFDNHYFGYLNYFYNFVLISTITNLKTLAYRLIGVETLKAYAF